MKQHGGFKINFNDIKLLDDAGTIAQRTIMSMYLPEYDWARDLKVDKFNSTIEVDLNTYAPLPEYNEVFEEICKAIVLAMPHVNFSGYVQLFNGDERYEENVRYRNFYLEINDCNKRNFYTCPQCGEELFSMVDEDDDRLIECVKCNSEFPLNAAVYNETQKDKTYHYQGGKLTLC